MTDKIAAIAGGLLGLIFVVFGLNFFLKFIPLTDSPDGAAAQFMGALYGSGYLSFVKVMEIAGGVLTAIPKTRNLGLIILVPIIVNIFAYKLFLQRGGAVLDPVFLVILALTLVVGLASAKSFLRLLN
ncbi:MAG: hypothetical protein P1U89_25745 [Verrucomicrobiales bacterium]|nr:hypothetical protein [Verrucomicrobiales bacterium]